MKMKLSLVGVAIVTISLGLALSSGAFAQMYGNKSSQSSSKSSGTPGADANDRAKPGAELTGGIIVATPITKEEAAQKYPAPKGGYPMGERDMSAKSGLIQSPYPPRKMFDCSKIGHGELVLDTYAKHVFVRP